MLLLAEGLDEGIAELGGDVKGEDFEARRIEIRF